MFNKLCGRPPQYARCLQIDLSPFDLESGVPSHVGYLCANFSLPISLSVIDLGPMNATDRQTSDAHYRLMHPPYRGGE